MAKNLAKPQFGKPIDTAGKPVTQDPVEGGVAIVNSSVPADHDAHVVWREQTADEKKDRRAAEKEASGFRRASTIPFVKMTRARLLQATDHFETLPEERARKIAGGPKNLAAWLDWRQQLLDLPAKVKPTAEPEDVPWPKPPAAIDALLEERQLWPDLDWKEILE